MDNVYRLDRLDNSLQAKILECQDKSTDPKYFPYCCGHSRVCAINSNTNAVQVFPEFEKAMRSAGLIFAPVEDMPGRYDIKIKEPKKKVNA